MPRAIVDADERIIDRDAHVEVSGVGAGGERTRHIENAYPHLVDVACLKGARVVGEQHDVVIESD